MLCYPVLYISWNPRCRVQEKSSSRGKVSPQRSRSGKPIRWNGREETRSKLFPLFFLFSPSFEKRVGVGGSPWSVAAVTAGKEAMTRGTLVYCDRMGQLLMHLVPQGHRVMLKSVCLLCIFLSAGMFVCFLALSFCASQKLHISNTGINLQQLKKINKTGGNSMKSPNRSYQVCVYVAIMRAYVHWLQNSSRWKVAKRC